jgi:putative ABC transport system permease protein
MNALWQDARYGLRMFAKAPFLTAVAVVTLALGIGANTGVLSVGRTLLYRPLPYRSPDGLVVLWGKNLKQGWDTTMVSVPDVLDWQRQASSFDSITGITWTDYQTFSLASDSGAERLRGAAVLPKLFETLQVQPLIGRGFLLQEFIGEQRVLLLGFSTWETRFAADRRLLGHTIRLNREPYTVVGVLPKDFELPVLDDGVEVVVPLRLDSPDALDRKQRIMFGVGRRKTGATMAQVQTEMTTIGNRLATEYKDDAGYSVNVQNLREGEGLKDLREKLPIFLVTVTLMVLIAAANVAGILLSRFAARKPELVVRSALGASRTRLLQQLLTESVLLTGIAGALALAVAKWVATLLISYKPFYMPYRGAVALGSTALLLIPALAFAIGILFGLLPALSFARTNLNEVMNRSSARVGGAWIQETLRNALVSVEVGLSVALVIGAALMVGTSVRISRVNLGFNPQGLALGRATLDSQRYPSASNQIAFYQSLIAQLQSQPGVEAATAISHFGDFDPLGWDMGNPIAIPGQPKTELAAHRVSAVMAVMPGFFSSFGMPVLRGREFRAQEGAPAIIVDQNFANKFFPNQDPIGKQVELLQDSMRSDETVQPGLRTIIGVVPAVRRIAYWAKPYLHAYVPFGQNPVPSMYVMVRTRDANGTTLIRKAVAGLDSEVPVWLSATMDGWISQFYASQRFELLVMAAFGGIALLISATGLYAVITHRVSQRTRELGIRLALGATRHEVEWVILRQAGLLIGIGISAGLLTALAIGQLLSKFLFGVRPHDPLTFGIAAAFVTAISLIAVYVPARRAALMDPLVALKYE